jgi:hypothetical protein
LAAAVVVETILPSSIPSARLGVQDREVIASRPPRIRPLAPIVAKGAGDDRAAVVQVRLFGGCGDPAGRRAIRHES